MVRTERDGDVLVARMEDGENRFNPGSVAELEAVLDEAEGTDGPSALVLTGEGKFFSNGLDLEWMGSAPDGGAQELAERVMRLLARLLLFGRPTVAAINGHCFAAGAMLSLCCDARVMRADRGFWCLPEADIQIPFTLGMSRLISSRLEPQVAHEAMLSARRYGGTDALDARIVDLAVAEESVLPSAVELAAAGAGRSPVTLAAIKRGLYADVAATLERPLTEQSA